jgi:hypothetical protein
MRLIPKVVLLASMALGLVSAGAAKDVALPKIDLQKLCRASQIDLHAEGESGVGSIDSCVMDEQEARDQIIKDWASYSAADRARCIHPGDYLPSYIEWLTCMQMNGDARKLRGDQPAETVGAGSGGRRASRRSGNPAQQCPIMHYNQDGSVDWVIAC